MSVPHHKILAAGRWRALSLAEQLGNIGSEVHRALCWQGKDEERFRAAVERTLELFDLTLDDPRWRDAALSGTGRGRVREIARAHEVFCDTISGGREYRSTLQDLDDYFLAFAVLARSRQGI